MRPRPRNSPEAPVVDPRRRLRQILWLFVALVSVVFARIVSLEWSYGAGYRAAAMRPAERERREPALRGRILAADGTVLAQDETVPALAMHYRYLESPPNERWLRTQARARLSRAEARDPAKLQAEMAQVAAELEQLHRRLATQCELTSAELRVKFTRIQSRVERISQGVNQRRQVAAAGREAQTAAADASDPWWRRVGRLVVDTLTAPDDAGETSPVTVAEELDFHHIHAPLAGTARTEIEEHPEHYPGVRVVEQSRRLYAHGPLAAHVLGHLGAPTEDDLRAMPPTGEPYQPHDRVGRLGIERRFEIVLRGATGLSMERLDRRGRLLATEVVQPPQSGQDVTLTLDVELQRTAEQLLDGALALGLHPRVESTAPAAGGAIVVLDVETGAILAAASGPRFDPAAMSHGDPEAVAALMADGRKPLFDRACRMALPPGSVFKTLTAIALLQDGTFNPGRPFFCRGYLEQPDRQRCLIYRRDGVGHGPTTLADALAQSCNVYFYHHATTLGAEPLVSWATRFGFGQRTGIELYEAEGNVPRPHQRWQAADTQALAIGQSELTTTPLQVARLMAAVANGGRLVTPHVVARIDGEAETLGATHPPREIVGLHTATLEEVSRGLERVVADPQGTAYSTVRLESVTIAGKTGTAETGGGQADHAWFAGYAPAHRPRVAFAVALEHAGDGSEAAGPVARRLVAKLERLGYFEKSTVVPAAYFSPTP